MYKKLIVSISLCVLQPLVALSDYEKQFIPAIPFYDKVAEDVKKSFEDLPPHDYPHVLVNDGSSNPLFRAYPALQSTLSYISLGDLPTPIHYCEQLSAIDSSTALYIKHDGVTGTKGDSGVRAFGGNKLRKLQYLLADAMAHGHDTVMTFGCVGSNHAVQTAACAKQVGLACICMLKPQPNSHIVQKNLLLQKAYGSTLIFSEDNLSRASETINQCVSYKNRTNMVPYVIPTGGSTARGAIGYVEAAFELKEQIDAGLIPTPDHIYVTLGSGGTAAGLLVGCKAAGIETHFHFILDEPGDIDHIAQKLQELFHATNDLLVSLDPAFPRCEFVHDDYCIVDAFSGTDYGLFTPEGVEAIRMVKALEGIELDGVYTGKCMSALLADLNDKKLEHSTVLFWDTFCAEDVSSVIGHIDYHELPHEFHTYFESDVQPLDC